MMKARFWGTRGSIPTPGPGTVKYGGNTSCVEVRVNGEIFIFDAGTGIRELGYHLIHEFNTKPLNLSLFISHTHWDHIQGFPFFHPAYQSQNHIVIYGPPGREKSFEDIIRDQMDTDYFPVAIGDLSPNLKMMELREPLKKGSVTVYPFYLNHPAMTLAFKITDGKHSVVYATDNEPYAYTLAERKEKKMIPSEFGKQQDQKLIDFISGTDLYIAEAQYTSEEYLEKIGWGHSPIETVVDFALKGKVKRLALFHHDPLHNDDMVDGMVEHARRIISAAKRKIDCFGAREGLEVTLE